MSARRPGSGALVLMLAAVLAGPQAAGRAQEKPPPLDQLKKDVIAAVEARRDVTQQMVDSLFSFSELGFQEIETERYITAILEKNGFTVRRGVADIPTAWVATWGNGRPVIALGTDVDGVPTTNQTPGVVTRKELVPGAPGHGEGHNAGQALIVTAALAVKTDHGAREDAGHTRALAWNRRGAPGDEGVLRPGGRVQGRRRGAVRARRSRARDLLG